MAIANVLDLWQEQMDGIKIEIFQEDIFGMNSYKYEKILPRSPY